MTKQDKTERILDCAFELLKARGDYGVTMRQIAQQAGMSLSNVQYYFANKDVLLAALADRYFKQCLQELDAVEELHDAQSLSADLTHLLHGFLRHGHAHSEMCRIFREYWAISSRNAHIEEVLHKYYAALAQLLAAKLRHVAHSEAAAEKAATLIIPYAEGYSVTAPAMPVNTESMATLLSRLLIAVLTENGRDDRM